MLKDMVLDIFGASWPTIILCSIILCSIRITYLIVNKQKFIFYKELTYLLFVIYILSLFYIVTFQDDNIGTSNFIPFKEITRYDVTSRIFFKNIIGNILLFMPFGLFVTAYLKSKTVYPGLIITFISSVSVEVIQLMIGRTFDVDDIILNVLGGVIGSLIFIILDNLRDRLPNFLNKAWFMNLLMILLSLGVIVYFTNLHVYIFG